MKEQVIYNVTIKVAEPIATAWLNWLLEEHVPEVVATGCFQDARVVRLLEVDDSEGPTYAIQYIAPDHEHYQRYIDEYAAVMRAKSFEKWGDRFIAFRSVMRVVM
jgi:hypothetical protein